MASAIRVLITGASGFLGRHIIAVLKQRRECSEIIASGLQRRSELDGVPYIACNLLDHEQTNQCCRQIRPTHVLHLAWNLPPHIYWHAPDNAAWALATYALAASAVRHGAHRFVASGTCAEYSPSSTPCHEETTPTCPTTAYGRAKLAAVRMLLSLCDAEKLSVAWGRIFYPFGSGDAPGRLLPSALRAIQENRCFSAASASQILDFLAVEDVAKMFVHLLFSSHDGIVNLGSGNPVSVAQILQELFRRAGKEQLLQLNSQQRVTPLVADVARRRRWLPEITPCAWQKALAEYMAQEQAQW